MRPETNSDLELSIYYDYLEDQGVDTSEFREFTEDDQWFNSFIIVNKVGGNQDFGVSFGSMVGGNEQKVGVISLSWVGGIIDNVGH